MKLLKVTVALICAALSFTMNAQEIEFGEITKAELKEQEYSLDKDANASVLYRYQNTYYTTRNGVSRLVTNVQERIKIYSKDGFEHATELVNLYTGVSDSEVISKIRAFTYNLENDNIVKTPLEKDQIFKTKTGYNYKQIKFTMPKVKEGSVIEFKYTVTSPFIWNIDEFRFQRKIPVKKIEALIRTPKGFNIKQLQKGYLSFKPNEKTQQDARVGMDVKVTTYNLENIPALKEEPYVDNMDNYRAGVTFELVSIELPGIQNRYFSKTWSDVAKSIGSSDDYKKELDKSKVFDDELDVMLTDVTDDFEKVKLLFKHVKSITEWNGVDGKYFQNGIKKTLKEKKGNAADINLLLVAMLRYAGLKANPIILSTKDNAIPFFPTLDRLNYVIAHVKIGDKEYYMDATEEFSDINVLPVRDYNWGGLFVDNPNKNWKHIYSIDPIKSSNRYALEIAINDDGSANGKYRCALLNHSAYQFRDKVKDKDLDSRIESRESDFQGIEIEEYELKHEDTYEGAVSENFNFVFDNAVDLIGDKMYLYPMLFLRTKENPFKEEIRDYPIDFGFPIRNQYIINISIPENYEVESIPEPISVALPEDMGKFKYMMQNNANKIQLSVTFEMNKAMISATNYTFLKEYFNKLIRKQAEQIVLSKV